SRNEYEYISPWGLAVALSDRSPRFFTQRHHAFALATRSMTRKQSPGSPPPVTGIPHRGNWP
ncbi:hypothetical protein E4U33_001023, partial [Claviceps sp. LM78 group G4]